MNKLLLVGLLVIVAGMLVILMGSVGQAGVSTGGFVLIGPFPIVFGSGSNGGQLATLAFAVGVLMLALLALYAWRIGSLRGKDSGNP
jgi:uncharacterized membrane protein